MKLFLFSLVLGLQSFSPSYAAMRFHLPLADIPETALTHANRSLLALMEESFIDWRNIELQDAWQSSFYSLPVQDVLSLYEHRIKQHKFFGLTKELRERLVDLTHLPNSGVEDFISFIRSKLGTDEIIVGNYLEFIRDPRAYLTGQHRSIFIVLSGDDPNLRHYSTVVVTPFKHVQLVDSFSSGIAPYPEAIENELYRIVKEFNKTSAQPMLFVTFKGPRQTTGTDCPLFAVHSALHFYSSDSLIDLTHEELPKETFLCLFHSFHNLVPTQSISRLRFLRDIYKWFENEAQQNTVLGDQTETPIPLARKETLSQYIRERAHYYKTIPSPSFRGDGGQSDTSHFIELYEDMNGAFQKPDSVLAAGLASPFKGKTCTPLNIATPYFIEYPDEKIRNAFILALDSDFFLWRVRNALKAQ